MALERRLDAGSNRGCEGLRTLEDLARFILSDAMLSKKLKDLRHELRAQVLALCPAAIWARDAATDVGTSIQTSDEGVRIRHGDIAAAAGHRTAEAMRSLEEAAKLTNTDLATAIEQLRYQAYDAAAAVERKLGAGPVPQWKLCLLLTRSACRKSWQEVLEGSIAGGVDVVQIREKSCSDAELLDHGAEVMSVCHSAGVPVIMDDRVDLAMTLGAAGAHLGQKDLPLAAARRLCGRGLILGVSTHGVDEAAAAVEGGADYVGIGPMFSSHTRPELAPAGLERLTETWPVIGQLPHLAIGGISAENAGAVSEAGARGIAVGHAICDAEDPHAAAASILHASGMVSA